MDRRQFLKHSSQLAAASGLGALALGSGLGGEGAVAAEAGPAYHLPEHLPKRLSISMFLWNWVALATPGEPYYDLEKAVAGLPERGFNALRAEAGLNWCYRADGTPRGEIEFGRFSPVYHDHMAGSGTPNGTNRQDMLQRVVRLMELAKKYGVYVILTSWEYQDSTTVVADPKIRAEVMGIPVAQRYMRLARHHDRLLQLLKEKDLHRNVAYVEVHNEPDESTFPQGAEGKKLHHEAIAFLRDRHPDILVSADYCGHEPDQVPDNAQVYDQHTYVGLYTTALYRNTVWRHDFYPGHPRENQLLARLLKDDPIVPYAEFVRATPDVRAFWQPVGWLYHNIDVARFDQWILEQYQRDKEKLNKSAVEAFAGDAKEAARRHIPAVCDEAGYFAPVDGSKFELTPPGTDLFELLVDLAIEHGFWGMMPTTYSGPEQRIWDNPAWLRAINERFQQGRKRVVH